MDTVVYTPTSPLLAAAPAPALVTALCRVAADRGTSPLLTLAESDVCMATFGLMATQIGLDPALVLALVLDRSAMMRAAWVSARNPLLLTTRAGAPLLFASWASDAVPTALSTLLRIALPADATLTRWQETWIDRAAQMDVAQARPGPTGTLADCDRIWRPEMPASDHGAGLATLATQLLSQAREASSC